MANHRSAGGVPRVVSDLPVQLGALAPVFQRRRIAVGLDRRGNVVLARPHSIQVDFRGDRKHKRAALELVKPIEADNSEVRARYDPEATGVLTVYVPPTEAEINEETRWSLDGLNAQLDRFRRQGIRADLRHVILGAQSLIPLVLSGAATRSPMLAPRLTSAEPDSLATLLTTAEPVGPPVDLREPLNLRGRRRPRILVLDTGLATQAGPSTRRAEHTDLRRSRLGKRLHVHLHHPWGSSNEVDATDDEDEPDDDRSGTLDFEAGTRHVHRRDRPPDLPGRRDPSSGRAVQLRRGRHDACARCHSPDDGVVRSVRHRPDVLRGVLHRRRSGSVRRERPRPARRRVGRSPPPATTARAVRTSRRRCRG